MLYGSGDTHFPGQFDRVQTQGGERAFGHWNVEVDHGNFVIEFQAAA